MIINRIWAEHVLKYAELDLNHLPSEGIIAISGQNEAGKSTIGEIVCFALFGRTFSLAPDEIMKVIRWGEPRCAARVEFTIDDAGYEVSRFLDDSGTQGARLTKQGVEEPLARGAEAVRDALAELLGFGFEEFIESFYLAQREITTPHPHSAAVKRMAGIAELERVAVVAEIEIEHEHTSIAETNDQILACENQLTELALDEERLPQLEAAHRELVTKHEQAATQIAELEATIAANEDTAAKVTAAIEPMHEVAFETSFVEWKTCVSRLDGALAEIASRHQNDDALALDDLQTSAHDAKAYLERFEQLKEPVGTYREHLANQLGENTGQKENVQNGPTLAEQQATCMRAHDRTELRHGKMRTGFILLLVLAVVGWLALGLVNFGPDGGVFKWVRCSAAYVAAALTRRRHSFCTLPTPLRTRSVLHGERLRRSIRSIPPPFPEPSRPSGAFPTATLRKGWHDYKLVPAPHFWTRQDSTPLRRPCAIMRRGSGLACTTPAHAWPIPRRPYKPKWPTAKLSLKAWRHLWSWSVSAGTRITHCRRRSRDTTTKSRCTTVASLRVCLPAIYLPVDAIISPKPLIVTYVVW